MSPTHAFYYYVWNYSLGDYYYRQAIGQFTYRINNNIILCYNVYVVGNVMDRALNRPLLY